MKKFALVLFALVAAALCLICLVQMGNSPAAMGPMIGLVSITVLVACFWNLD